MSKPEEYGICIRLIRQDDSDLFEGRVNELPDLKVYCESYTEAYEELIDAIGTAQELFAEQGRGFPQAEPTEDSFSGRVTLRMSKSLHRCVHEKASRDGVSLNQWIVEAIGCRVNPPVTAASAAITTPTIFYVMSPARRADSDVTFPCFQQAAHVASLTHPGGTVSLLSTLGVVESISTPALGVENNSRWTR